MLWRANYCVLDYFDYVSVVLELSIVLLYKKFNFITSNIAFKYF
jgi:hypothetical protein